MALRHRYHGLWYHLGQYGPQDLHVHPCTVDSHDTPDEKCSHVLIGLGRECGGKDQPHERAVLSADGVGVKAARTWLLAQAAGVPTTARLKRIRRRWWEPDDAPEPVVYLDERTKTSVTHSREFVVYAEDGTELGRINSWEGTITPLSRTSRLVRHGKRRTFWSTGPGDAYKHLESQAAAIRILLDRRAE